MATGCGCSRGALGLLTTHFGKARHGYSPWEVSNMGLGRAGRGRSQIILLSQYGKLLEHLIRDTERWQYRNDGVPAEVSMDIPPAPLPNMVPSMDPHRSPRHDHEPW